MSPDGSKVFVAGHSTGSTGDLDFAVIAYAAANGAKLWVKRYKGPGDSFDSAHSRGVSPDGTKVFVAGESWLSGSGDDDFTTVAYSTG